MRLSVCLSVCLSALCLTASPSIARATYCSSTCPETGYHSISIRDFFGNVQPMNVANSYRIGRQSNDLLVACTGTTVHYLYDDTAGQYLTGGLLDDSAICWGTGNDEIQLMRTTWSCGSVSYYPFDSNAYNGHVMYMHGEAGDDELYGANGSDKLCGGTEDDVLLGYGGNDVLDGLDDDDHLEGGYGNDEMWGYNGADCIYDKAGTGDYLNGEGGFDTCVWANGSSPTVNCDGGGGDSENGTGTDGMCTARPSGWCVLACGIVE